MTCVDVDVTIQSRQAGQVSNMVSSRGVGEEDNWGAEAEYEKQTPAHKHTYIYTQSAY